MKKDELSKEAQELIALTQGDGLRIDGDVDISVILKDRPELMDGLNEYMKWRDNEQRMTSEKKKDHPISHGLMKKSEQIVKVIKKKTEGKNKK